MIEKVGYKDASASKYFPPIHDISTLIFSWVFFSSIQPIITMYIFKGFSSNKNHILTLFRTSGLFFFLTAFLV